MGRWTLAAALGVVVVALVPSTALAATDLSMTATSPSPSPDLRSDLAPAPSSDWVESGPSPYYLTGPFTAHSYAQRLSGQKNQADAEAAMNQYGFLAGYGRAWLQRGTRDLLAEDVFEFQSEFGADYWYNQLRIQVLTSPDYMRSLSGLDPIPEAYGAILQLSDGFTGYSVGFRKRNLAFIVDMSSAKDDLASATVAQALATYSIDQPRSAIPKRLTAGASATPVVLAIGAAGLLVLLTAVLVLVLLTRRTPPTASREVQFSPDGYYWWDGAKWRLVATDPPPQSAP